MFASSRTLATAAVAAVGRHAPRGIDISGAAAVRVMGGTAPSTTGRRLIHVEKRLDELGIELPKPSAPRANYNIVCHAAGNMLYVSGHLPFQADGTLMTGRIGEDGRDKDYGYLAARHAGLNIISTLKEQLGDLDRIEQIVKVRFKLVLGSLPHKGLFPLEKSKDKL